MKAQAEKFMITGQALKQAGVRLTVHGDGLLPTMWNTLIENISEQNKYKLMWQMDEYRTFSPGEFLVDLFMQHVRPDGLVIDFGCGTGRAALAISKRDIPVLLIDFADNCRDEEAMNLPFMEWDLSLPMPPTAEYGNCCDVMEHIPVDKVAVVVENILQSARKVFFSISTTTDCCGALIKEDLHVTIRPHEWWQAVLEQVGTICWQQQAGTDSFFVVQRTIQ